MDKPRSEKLSELLKMVLLVEGIQNQPSDSIFLCGGFCCCYFWLFL